MLTLNRPEVGNAYNDELRFTFLATLREAGGSARPLAFNCRPTRRMA